jgi:PilZ domain
MLSTSKNDEMRMSAVRGSCVPGKRRRLEQRRHVRYSFTGTIEAVEPETDTRLQGRTSDLSEGGCYADTLSPFPAGTRVKVRVTKEGRSFETLAEVVYSVAGMGMGLRFDAAEQQQLDSLKSWLTELSGGSEEEIRVTERTYPADPGADNQSILNDLVSKLVRKGAVNEAAGAGILEHSL